MNLELPAERTARQTAKAIGWAVVTILVITFVAAIYWRGRKDVSFDNVQAQLRTTEESAGISLATADTVATEQAGTWAHAQADEGEIRARIDAQPRAAGPADPDILRVAREAHARALCAAGRVQRTDCGDDTARAPDD